MLDCFFVDCFFVELLWAEDPLLEDMKHDNIKNVAEHKYYSLKVAIVTVSHSHHMAASEVSVAFTDSLTDWDIKHATLTTFLQQQQDLWGQQSRFEVLQHGQLVQPYFDADKYLDHEPTPAEKAECLATCRNYLFEIFNGDPAFTSSRIMTAHRHGFVPAASKWKLSYRFWITGYAILVEDMPALIQQTSPPAGRTWWDLSVYSARKKLGCVGSYKSPGDLRVLEVDDHTTAEWCLAQRLGGSEQELVFNKVVPAGGTLANPMEAPEWEAVQRVLEQAGFGNPVYKGRRAASLTFTCDLLGQTCVCCGLVHDSNNWWCSLKEGGGYAVKNYSERCRVMTVGTPVEELQVNCDPPATSLNQALVKINITAELQRGADSIHRDCLLARQHLEHCPSCSRHHPGDLWYIYPLLHQCWSFRNADLDCSEKVLSQGNKHLMNILKCPTAEMAYVELYISESQQQLKSTALHPSGQILRFDGVRWQTVADGRVQAQMQTWLRELLQRLSEMMAHESMHLSASVHSAKTLKDLISKLTKAIDYVQHENTISNMLKGLKRHTLDEFFDKNKDTSPWTLGTDDGIVDLQTCTFRQAMPEDNVTMSVGYCFSTAPDLAVEEEVESFMRAMYPEEHERDMFQLYAGYTMIGAHPEKVLLVLSDQRDGNNGKSTLLSLLMAAMGEYATKMDASILYRQDKVKSINDHSAGLMTLEKKRLMVIEELDPSKVRLFMHLITCHQRSSTPHRGCLY